MLTKVIVTKSSFDANTLIGKLTESGFDVEHLPVFEVNDNKYEFDELIIGDKTKLFFSSPTSISLASDYIKKLDSVELIVPGAISAERIKQINPKLRVNYPVENFGVSSIIEKKLLSPNDCLLVFGGNEINRQLENHCKHNRITIRFISLYRLVNIFTAQINQLNKLINSAKCYLIVASSTVANTIVESLSQIDIDTLQQNLIIVSLHEKITKIFQAKYHVKVVEVLEMQNDKIVSVLKNLEAGEQNGTK